MRQHHPTVFPVEVFCSKASAANLLEQGRWNEGLWCPHCQSESVIKYGSYQEYQRYRCENCGCTFNDKIGMSIFVHAKIDLDELLFALHLLLRFDMSLRQLDTKLDSPYRSLLRCVEPSGEPLDAPRIDLVDQSRSESPVDAWTHNDEREWRVFAYPFVGLERDSMLNATPFRAW